MKMASDCYSCILDRAKFEADLVLKTEEEKAQAVEELVDFMACHKRGIPALVGTEREKIIQRRSGGLDPYESLKADSNRLALDLLPAARKLYEESKNKLEALMRIAAAANSMEFGVKGHDFDNSTFKGKFQKTLEENLSGDLSEVERRLSAFQNVFYLTDNAGEVVFDLFVVEKLKEMGKRIVMGSKAEPVLNDVTVQELRGMTSTEVIPTGSVVGTSLECLSPEAEKLLFDKSWLILSKGMGNFETISEYQEKLSGRLIYILRAKCSPVASALGVQRGTLVVRII
jgi:uncharacterized protein with ATP-grasp and redox domains